MRLERHFSGRHLGISFAAIPIYQRLFAFCCRALPTTIHYAHLTFCHFRRGTDINLRFLHCAWRWQHAPHFCAAGGKRYLYRRTISNMPDGGGHAAYTAWLPCCREYVAWRGRMRTTIGKRGLDLIYFFAFSSLVL
jgi:hypothetical protein